MSCTNTAKLCYGVLLESMDADLKETFDDNGEAAIYVGRLTLSVARIGDDCCVADGKLALIVDESVAETEGVTTFGTCITTLDCWHDALLSALYCGQVEFKCGEMPGWMLSVERR